MSAEKLSLLTREESAHTTSARSQMLASFRDFTYRQSFVKERVRSSIALQIRALRLQRDNMSQKQLGDAMGMAQTWVSKLENPDYGKMTVATLLRLAEAFDTDLEIKFRPFSATVDTLPRQGPDYFVVPSFNDEFGEENPLSPEDLQKVRAIEGRLRPLAQRGAISRTIYNLSQGGTFDPTVPMKKPVAIAASERQEQYGSSQNPISQNHLAL